MLARDAVADLMVRDAIDGAVQERSYYYRVLFGTEYESNLRVVCECGGSEDVLMDAYDSEEVSYGC